MTLVADIYTIVVGGLAMGFIVFGIFQAIDMVWPLETARRALPASDERASDHTPTEVQ